MVLTKEQFAQSFMYLAPDVDIQPLLRFSHVTDTFVYVNLGRSESYVLEALHRKLRYRQHELTISEIGQRFRDRDLDIDWDKAHIMHAWPKWMTAEEIDSYRAAFHRWRHKKEWGREIILERIIGSVRRKLRLLYLEGEAIASYLCLSRLGAYPPKYLCTIQSGVMEEPNGLFERMVARHPRLPSIWTRGFAPANYQWGMREAVNFNCALDETGLYRHKVQTHIDWKGYDGARRYVASFAMHPRSEAPRDEETEIRGQNRCVRLVRRAIRPSDLDAFDLLFANRHAAETMGVAQNPKVILWDQHGRFGRKSLVWTLKDVADQARKRSAQQVLMLPVGYEDEGVYFREWVRDETIKYPELLEVRFVDPLDYADVRKEATTTSLVNA